MSDPSLWLAVWISGGTYNYMRASLHASKEECVAELTVTPEEHAQLGWAYGRWSPERSKLNGFCIPVADAVVPSPMTYKEAMGIK